MAYIIDYSKHLIFYFHSLHLKLVQGSLVVEWCFEWNHIHELKEKGKKWKHLPLSNALIDDDDSNLTIELKTFAKNIKEVIGAIEKKMIYNYFVDL
jgi:hypothetical protein